MKKYRVILTYQADRDLRGIYEYIAWDLNSPESAAGQLNRLEQAITKLEVFPERHRFYEEGPWRTHMLRIMPVDNFIVFYISDNDSMTVTVIRVMFGGRNIEEQLNRFTD